MCIKGVGEGEEEEKTVFLSKLTLPSFLPPSFYSTRKGEEVRKRTLSEKRTDHYSLEVRLYAVFHYAVDLKQCGRNVGIESHLRANSEEVGSFSNYKLVELPKFNAGKPGDLQIMFTLLPHGYHHYW